jgi:hypothetical protein
MALDAYLSLSTPTILPNKVQLGQGTFTGTLSLSYDPTS